MSNVQCATKALIVKDGKFLVIRHSYGKRKLLDLPGGRVEYGLSPEENLTKEVKEEVFLDVKVEKIIGAFHFFRMLDGDQVVCIVYLCKPLTDKVDLSKNPVKYENIISYKWVTLNEFLEMKADNPETLERMKKIVKNHFESN